VLGDVGEVSGVIDMPIVHWPHCALTRAWAAGRMPPPMLTLPRRVFLTAATAVLAASRRSAAGAAPAQPRGGDQALSGMLIVNALGGLEDPNLKDSAGSVLEPRVLRDAHDSGLTAVNVTLGYVSGDADPFEQSVRDIAQMDGWVREGARDLLKIYTADDILRARAAGRIGIIYGFQNAAMLGSDVTRVDLFANLGVRVIQLTYNPANALGDGSMAAENRGLTPFGRDVVERLNARRVMVDLSHSGQRTCLEAARVSKQPISINHTGCRALNDLPRNKTDEELALVASKGGFVGIYFMPFLNPTGHATAADVVAHIEHAVNVCGEDHVGIGTDGSTTAIDDLAAYKSVLAAEVAARRQAGVSAAGERPDTLPFVVDLRGVNQFRDLAGRLSRRGYSTARIEKIMGQNFQRYAREVWGA
jgi:membrane dipeptidase